MPAISLRAHFDGESIRLDEPYVLPSDAQLLVTILSPESSEMLPGWVDLGAATLSRAYGDDEPEYSALDVTP